jgi:hypothetical protein
MPIAIANGANETERKAASDANAVQDGCNLIAIVGCFHRHLIAMRDSGICGDNLNNHAVSLTFTSKLNALCRLTDGREIAALIAIDRIEDGERVEYEVIPLCWTALARCGQPNTSVQGDRNMASTRVVRQGQIEIGVIEHNGNEFAAYGSTTCGRQITGYVRKDHGQYQLTRWNGEVMLSCRSEIVKEFWCGALALMFRLPRGRFVVGYALTEGLFRGELIDHCTVEEARSHAWMIADNLAELDLEDQEADLAEV